VNDPVDGGGDGMTSRRAFMSHGVGIAVTALVSWLPTPALQGPRFGKVAGDASDDVNMLPSAPVVSFHLDQPYLDMTGRGVPYIPPPGMRSGQSIADLSEHAFHSAYPYL
jgi:hypothetical protein